MFTQTSKQEPGANTAPIQQEPTQEHPLQGQPLDYAQQSELLAPGGGLYTVRRGDTLGKIAAAELGSASQWRSIYDANRAVIRNPNVIHPGQQLAMPGAPAPVKAPAPAPAAEGTYTVRRGDTLGKIAARLLGKASQWRALWDANRATIRDPNAIRVGQVLTIPGSAPATPVQEPEPEVDAAPTPTPSPTQEGPGGGEVDASPEGIRHVAMQITEVLETGGLGRYAALNDYDGGIISYGKHQATLASGALEALLTLYLSQSSSSAAGTLDGYMDRVRQRDPKLRNDVAFKEALREAAEDPVMQSAQDAAIIESHYKPAAAAANAWGIETPLGISMLYDTNIQGGMANVLGRTRSALGGVVGDKGITEHAFLQRFNDLRRARLLELAAKAGLSTAHGKALKGSVYRCDAFDKILASGNLQLAGDVDVRGVSLDGLGPEAVAVERAPGDEPAPGAALLTPAQVAKTLDWYKVRGPMYPAEVVEKIQGEVGAEVDGRFGPLTVQAIASYQQARGLAVDGLAGPATLTEMFGEDIRPKGIAEGGVAPGTMGFKRPNGLNEVIGVFGQPGTNLGSFAIKGGAGGKLITVTAHKLVGPLLQKVFEDIAAAGLGHHIQSYDGIYNYRTKRKNSSSWSTHAWGIAIDVNASSNPMVGAKNLPSMSITESQQALAPYFERHGFYWGSNFGDPMHFQYCTGY